jgi:hypothetical protein
MNFIREKVKKQVKFENIFESGEKNYVEGKEG